MLGKSGIRVKHFLHSFNKQIVEFPDKILKANVFQFMAQFVHMAVISNILHGQTQTW